MILFRFKSKLKLFLVYCTLYHLFLFLEIFPIILNVLISLGTFLLLSLYRYISLQFQLCFINFCYVFRRQFYIIYLIHSPRWMFIAMLLYITCLLRYFFTHFFIFYWEYRIIQFQYKQSAKLPKSHNIFDIHMTIVKIYIQRIQSRGTKKKSTIYFFRLIIWQKMKKP